MAYNLSEELGRIQDLQRRSFHGLQQVQAHQTMLQNSLDKLQLLVADGQVKLEREESATEAADVVQENRIVPSLFEGPNSPTEYVSQDKAFVGLRGNKKSLHMLKTLEHEGLLEESFLNRLRRHTQPLEKSLPVQIAQKVVRHPAFELLVGIIILSNLVVQGFEIEHSLLLEPKSEWPVGVEIGFVSFYTVELILRLLAFGMSVFTDTWFLMDLIIVVSSLAGLVLYSSGNSVSVFLVIRGLRLLRLGRSLKGVNRFRIVWHLLHGLLSSSQVLLATFCLLVLAVYIAACIGVEIITKDEVLRQNPNVSHIVNNSFGSLALTMLTLIQFITLDSIWQIYIPLIEEKSWLVIYFLGILLILPITLMNLVTAVLVENGLTTAQREAEFENKARSAEMRSAVMQLLDLFNKLDSNTNGSLSRLELSKVPEKSIPTDLLDALAVEDLVDLFDMLDVDHTGEISQEEFVDGVLRMVVNDVPTETLRMMKLLQSVHRGVHSVSTSCSLLLSNAEMTSVL